MTLPREIIWKDDILYQYPIKEVDALRGEKVIVEMERQRWKKDVLTCFYVEKKRKNVRSVLPKVLFFPMMVQKFLWNYQRNWVVEEAYEERRQTV